MPEHELADTALNPLPSSPVIAQATRAQANRIGNWFLPIYRTADDSHKFPVEDPDEQLEFDVVCANAQELWAPTTQDEAVADVFMQFCRLLPKLDLVSLYHAPDQAEFCWSRIRCIIGGAGHALHPLFAAHLTNIYPQCPLRAEETYEEWRAALDAAHRNCGWPITMGLLDWASVAQALRQTTKGAPIQPWVRVVALFHILKHLRYSRTFGLVVVYKNTVAGFSFDETASNVLGSSGFCKSHVSPALGCVAAADPKAVHPLTAAVDQWFRVLSTSDLLRRKTTTTLPGVVQHGPWSTLSPDPVATHGFIQHGARLAGVWLAQAGRIHPTTGESADIVGYDWAMNPDEFTHQRQLFEAALPTTYDTTATPFEVFTKGFPNLNTRNFGGDTDAAACLFDAVVCASLIRPEVPSLAIEKPIVMCMPSTPTLDESTNQGKSKAAHTIARALVPGIPLIGVPDSDSPPDMRAITSTIRRYGTLCGDEWRQPKKKSHVLSHENLQLLITGGAVSVGEVLANDVEPLYLQHPIVVSCKAIDAPPDIINRSLVFVFDQLTNEQRANGTILDEIETGKLSLRIRLAALALCERLGLADQANLAPKTSTAKGWRFNTLRAIANVIWKSRHGGADGSKQLDLAIQHMQAGFSGHTREAEENGLLATLEEGSAVRLRLYSVFHAMTAQELDLFRASTTAHAGGDTWTSLALLRGRAELTGLSGKPLSMLCEHLIGSRPKAADRSIASALMRDIRGVMPNVGDDWLLPDLLGMAGWRLVRLDDVAMGVRVTLKKDLRVSIPKASA